MDSEDAYKDCSSEEEDNDTRKSDVENDLSVDSRKAGDSDEEERKTELEMKLLQERLKSGN